MRDRSSVPCWKQYTRTLTFWEVSVRVYPVPLCKQSGAGCRYAQKKKPDEKSDFGYDSVSKPGGGTIYLRNPPIGTFLRSIPRTRAFAATYLVAVVKLKRYASMSRAMSIWKLAEGYGFSTPIANAGNRFSRTGSRSIFWTSGGRTIGASQLLTAVDDTP